MPWISFARSLVVISFALAGVSALAGEKNEPMVRLAKLVIEPSYLAEYRTALTKEIEASLRLEPGVRTLYAVAEKNRPSHITILEIYADEAAYQAHIKTPHFLEYKTGTAHMVKSLELVESEPLMPDARVK